MCNLRCTTVLYPEWFTGLSIIQPEHGTFNAESVNNVNLS